MTLANRVSGAWRTCKGMERKKIELPTRSFEVKQPRHMKPLPGAGREVVKEGRKRKREEKYKREGREKREN